MNNGMWSVTKILTKIIFVMLCIVLIYLLIDFGANSNDIIETYTRIKQDDSKSEFSKSLQFLRTYTIATGDITLALNTGLTPEEAQGIIDDGGDSGGSGSNGGSGGNGGGNDGGYGPPVVDHNHYYYKQTNYSNVLSGRSTISSSGCGWVSMTVAMAELNSSKFGGYNPASWVTIMPTNVKNLWSGGMNWTAPSEWVKYVNTHNLGGQYTCRQVGTSFEQAIKDNAGSSNKVVLVSCNPGLFTGGGHIICVTDLIEENGKTYMHISDSSGVAARHLGINYDDAKSYSFPLHDGSSYVKSLNGYNYAFKQAWIIEKVG